MKDRQIVNNGLIINGYSSGATVFDVQGTQGQLFSISDNMVGELFSVSDISGIPILTVDSIGLVSVDGNLNVDGTIVTTGITFYGANLAAGKTLITDAYGNLSYTNLMKFYHIFT